MIRIILLRHAETKWNSEKRYLGASDLPLSAKGNQQAAAVAKILEDETIDIIYSSKLKRAEETSKIISKNLTCKLVFDARLRELNFGVFEGLTFLDAQENYPKDLAAWLNDYDQPPPGGESFSSLTKRISAFIEDIKMLDAPSNILIVTHGGPLREIFRLLLDLPSEKHWTFNFDPASRSEIHLHEELLRIVCTNSVSHLKGVTQ